MNYVILIIIALAGIALGMYLARRGKGDLISEQGETESGEQEEDYGIRTGTREDSE